MTISKHEAIEKAWELGAVEQKNKLARYRLLIECICFHAICIYEENKE